MHHLSAVIITHNEERNIARCLVSLQGLADDVVVVDSYSTDDTQGICQRMGVRFMQRAWDGYSAQRNFAMECALHNWVLAIDADEEISSELRASLVAAKAEGVHFNYRFNRKTNYCGQWIHHSGWYPDTKFRLFDRRECRWQGMVHETLNIPKSEVRKLKGDLLHYSYLTISEHIQRMDTYSTLAALELQAKGAAPSLFKIIFSPSFKFFRFYLWQLGVLDGVAGIVIASVSAYGTFLKYVKHWYLVKRGVAV